MIQFFRDVKIDWLGKRRIFMSISIALMLAGMTSAIYRQSSHPGGTDAFNLGVDFKGGILLTVRFQQPPSTDEIRTALESAGLKDVLVQNVLEKPNEMLIKLPVEEAQEVHGDTSKARQTVVAALTRFGSQNAEIVGTDAVGAIAGADLRLKAIAVTFAAMVGILLFIALRFKWEYGAGAIIAVFHTILIVLGLFSIFQWEVNMTVIAALLTLVGFSVNDSVVVFDRIRENLRLHPRANIYDMTNLSINQTLSRTTITAGLVFLSVLALVLFGGPTLRPFSLALFFGLIFGTYDSIAIASPIMVWWQQKSARKDRLLAMALVKNHRQDYRTSRKKSLPAQ